MHQADPAPGFLADHQGVHLQEGVGEVHRAVADHQDQEAGKDGPGTVEIAVGTGCTRQGEERVT